MAIRISRRRPNDLAARRRPGRLDQGDAAYLVVTLRGEPRANQLAQTIDQQSVAGEYGGRYDIGAAAGIEFLPPIRLARGRIQRGDRVQGPNDDLPRAAGGDADRRAMRGILVQGPPDFLA